MAETKTCEQLPNPTSKVIPSQKDSRVETLALGAVHLTPPTQGCELLNPTDFQCRNFRNSKLFQKTELYEAMASSIK